MRRTRKRRRKGGGLLDQLKKGVNAVGAAVRKAAGFEKKPKTRALTPEEVAELQRSTQRRLKSASNANEEGRRNAAMAGPSPRGWSWRTPAHGKGGSQNWILYGIKLAESDGPRNHGACCR